MLALGAGMERQQQGLVQDVQKTIQQRVTFVLRLVARSRAFILDDQLRACLLPSLGNLVGEGLEQRANMNTLYAQCAVQNYYGTWVTCVQYFDVLDSSASRTGAAASRTTSGESAKLIY